MITVREHEEITEAVARALMEECYGAGAFDAAHETQKRAFRKQANAAVAVVRTALAKLKKD